MVKLTVTSTVNFNVSAYFDVSQHIHYNNGDYYTDTNIHDSTLFSFLPGFEPNMKRSPLYFGHADNAGVDWTFFPDGMVTGRFGDEKLPAWLARKDLSDYTPESLVARIFVGADHLRGNAGNDVLDGHAGADTLLGREGDDTLIGGVGDDILTGGFGNDVLTGGFGADRFLLRELHDIVGGGEVITDFNHAQGDKIDFTRFDANVSTPQHELMIFIGQAAFGVTGSSPEVRVEVVSDTVNLLQFDVNADGKVDAVVTVNTTRVIDGSDILYPGGLPGEAVFGQDTVGIMSPHVSHVQHMELATGCLA